LHCCAYHSLEIVVDGLGGTWPAPALLRRRNRVDVGADKRWIKVGAAAMTIRRP
jgi:hypothetical protein